VSHSQLLHIQSVGFSVSFSVQQQVEDSLSGLLGPSALGSGDLHVLALSVSTNAASVLGEGHGLLVFEHVLEELLGLEELHATDGGHDLSALLEVNSHIVGSSLGRFAIFSGFLAVLSHVLTTALLQTKEFY
jgi:hypothetical protein